MQQMTGIEGRTMRGPAVRRSFLIFTALAASAAASAALASDLAPPRQPLYTKAPEPMEAAYDWSGFYAGFHLGYANGRARVVDNGVLRESAAPMDGAIGGLLAGYNWQSGHLVYGLEGDLSVSSLQGHGSAPPIVFPNEYDVNVSGNIRGRIGYSVLPHTLIYAAGGVAMAEFKLRDGVAPSLSSALLTGWTAGAGVDHTFAPNLIGRVEYLYSDYSNKNITIAPGDVYNAGFKTQTVRAAMIAQLDSSLVAPVGQAHAMAAVPVSWTGFYVGGDIGAAIESGDTTSNFSQQIIAPPRDTNRQGLALRNTKAAAGVHAGYNWQFTPSWVVGLEGDWQWVGAKTSSCRQTDVVSQPCRDNGFGFVNLSGETRSIGSVRGRLGYTIDHVLVYGTGGVAFADTSTTLAVDCRIFGCGQSTTPFAGSASSSTVKTGWVAGAGVETMLDHSWTVRTEYLHFDLGSVSNTFTLPAAACSCGVSWSRGIHEDLVRASLSYRIGG